MITAAAMTATRAHDNVLEASPDMPRRWRFDKRKREQIMRAGHAVRCRLAGSSGRPPAQLVI